MSSYKNTIVKGDPITKEAAAGGTLYPGYLVTLNSSGALIAHATAGGNAIPRFCVENSDIGDGVDDTYASGDNCKYVVARPGDEIQARMATGQNIAIGDALVSNANGQLKEYTAATVTVDMSKTTSTYTETIYDTTIVGYALEANASTSANDKLLIEAA